MKYRKWALIVAGILLPFTAQLPTAFASQIATQYWGDVTIHGAQSSRVPYLLSDGTNYFGLWYFMHILSQRGIYSTWDGRSLKVTNMPAYDSQASMTIDSTVIPSSHLMKLNGETYLNLTALGSTMQWTIQYDAAHRSLQVGDAGAFFNKTHSFVITNVANPTTSVSIQKLWLPVTGWSQVPILRTSQTNYFGVWYMMQLLKKYGYSATWKYGKLDVGNLPQVVSGASVGYGSIASPTNLIQFENNWYVPVSSMASVFGISANVDSQNNVQISTTGTPAPGSGSTQTGQFTIDGTVTASSLSGAKVAVMDAAGNTNVWNVGATGAFTGTVTGDAATVVGVYTKSQGWVGKAAEISSAQAKVSVDAKQQLSTVAGSVIPVNSGERVAGGNIEFRSDLTHVHYTASVDSQGHFTIPLPVGAYEIWTVDMNGHRAFLGRQVMITDASTSLNIKLPVLPTSMTYDTRHATVVGESSDVTPEQLLSIGDLFEQIYEGDIQDTGLQPAGKVTIGVYGTSSAYTQHFTNEGYSLQNAQYYSEYSQAVSEGPQSISINLQGLTDEFGVDVMAHEFTHCLIDTVSNNIPSWVNEGVAWHEGIRAEASGTPSELLWSALRWNQWEDIVFNQQKGTLFPLGAVDALNPAYNVESQDYFAVEQLIHTFGLSKLMTYIRAIDKEGDSTAFQSTFGESESTFANQVTATLKDDAAVTDRGLTMTVRVLANGPQQLFVVNPAGVVNWYEGAQPGGTYTFVCNPDGSITAPSSLVADTPVSSSGDGYWYVGGQRGNDQGEFSINNAFGLGYLQYEAMFFNNSNNSSTQTATGLPIGLQIIAIQPN